MGYIALTNTLTWFHKRSVELEYEDYIHMLKMVGFSISDWFRLSEPLFSFDTVPTVLEATTRQSSRLSSLIGSIATSSQILQSTPTTNIAVVSLTMRVAGCFARLSLIGAAQCK
jgi:hypothetical protein